MSSTRSTAGSCVEAGDDPVVIMEVRARVVEEHDRVSSVVNAARFGVVEGVVLANIDLESEAKVATDLEGRPFFETQVVSARPG